MQVVEIALINLVSGNFLANSLRCLFIKAHKGILVHTEKQYQRTAKSSNYIINKFCQESFQLR